MADQQNGNIFGTVFDIQRFSLHDGPGVRTTVFLKGCPLRCAWCHNPEGLTARPQIMYDAAKCIGCGECVSVCAESAHVMSDGVHFYDRSKCTACAGCSEVCPPKAITVAGVRMSVPDVMEKVVLDRNYYGERGGMTLSGGEPLMQPEFSKALLEAAKNEGIKTALETSGYADEDKFRDVASAADLLLFDYKLSDDEEHLKYTGVTRAKIDANMKTASKLGIPMVLRCPIIPGVNDNEAHFSEIARTANKLGSVTEINVEPYHTLGLSKNGLLGIEDGFEAVPVKVSDAEEYVDIIRKMTDVKVRVSK